MASSATKTNLQRKRKRSKMGKIRKRREQSKGSTPVFPIHKVGEKK